jgi:peptide deformylase
LYNPQIIEESEEFVWEMEGCLTYPGLFIKISRPKSLSASWEDAENKNFSGYFSDLSARIFLHEMDHIKGKLFYEGASQLHIQNARRKRRSHLKKIKTSSPTLWQSHLNNKKQEKVSAKTF